MRRTAVHLLSSPNPAQLEMRILANHGGDRRFAFLRGRWGRAWKLAKAKARLEKEKPVLAATESKPAALGVLAGYGSDSDNSDGEEGKEESDSKELIPEVLPLPIPPPTTTSDEELAKEARRRRLKQWAEARKAAKDAT
ncbi:hypothetical protein BDN70DRAFT_877776 [Pholiota conissans]|uniref:Uncharacterized protein n=1 Tax=Pholiota conissans TaxID=109636 RepID=A0A9P5Z355_9AGAR|nr:hypothetical protein BDN70DRAFT_877776 [Pholiota conissans]